VSFLVFDIETRVDKALLRATQFAGLEIATREPTSACATAAATRSDGGSDFFPVTYTRADLGRAGDAGDDCGSHAVEVLGADQLRRGRAGARVLAARRGVRGTLVSFNGRGFDLPVLELQALRHGCALPR
jgi:predicted PolB exonuclease-like 3'-5' exonuclease